jgi:hypothetical protein
VNGLADKMDKDSTALSDSGQIKFQSSQIPRELPDETELITQFTLRNPMAAASGCLPAPTKRLIVSTSVTAPATDR